MDISDEAIRLILRRLATASGDEKARLRRELQQVVRARLGLCPDCVHKGGETRRKLKKTRRRPRARPA